MKIVLLHSALPVIFGVPRQRAAYGLRRTLSEFGRVDAVTIDCWNTEWHSRRQRAGNDLFFGHALPAHIADDTAFLSWPATPAPSSLAQGQIPRSEKKEQPDFEKGWMNERRRSRLTQNISNRAPDVIVCADQTLWSLAASICPEQTALLCLDSGLETWAASMRHRLQDPAAAIWFGLLWDRLTANREAMRRHEATCATFVPRVHQEESDLFMEKSEKILIPATGISFLDDQITKSVLQNLGKLLTSRDIRQKLVLFGLTEQQAKAAPGAEVHRTWTRLHTYLGTSRALVVPYITPDLLPFVHAALSVGTPVLTTPQDAARHNLGSRVGVYCVPMESICIALVKIQDDAYTSPEFSTAIANEEKGADINDTVDRLQDLLSNATKRKTRTLKKPSSLPIPVRSPLATPPEVLYDPIKEMLLVRIDLWSWSHLEELRLIAEDDQELTRISPNANQQAQHRYLLEGGLVIPLETVGNTLRLQGYCDTEKLFDIEVPQDKFRQVDCGMLTLDVADGWVSGSFWINSSTIEDRWYVQTGREVTAVPIRETVEISDLGATILTFRAPSHHAVGRRQAIELLRSEKGKSQITLPAQSIADLKIPNPKLQRQRADIEALKGIHTGKRGWVIGNGPSVRLEDLAKIPDDDIVFCFNRFYLSYNDTPLREDYVVSADTLMIEDFGQEMIELSSGLPLFCMQPSAVSGLSGQFVQLPPGDVSVPVFSFAPESYVSVGGSSVYVALQMAWHMGLQDLALYGMDYSFSATLHRDPRYPFPVAYNDDNHFIKGYRNAKPWCPPTWRDISAGFMNARLAFEMTGRRIVNVTRGGRLELFPREDFDSLVKNSRD